MIARAFKRLPVDMRNRELAHAARLTSSQRMQLVAGLREGLQGLRASAQQALVAGILGIADVTQQHELRVLAAGRLAQLLESIDSIPQLDTQSLQFAQQVFEMMTPYLRALIAAALDRLPLAQRPLVLAADLAAVQQFLERYGVLDAADVALAFEDPQTHAFVQQAAYQAGQDCVYSGGCSSYDDTVNYIDAVPVMPALIQVDAADCSFTPVCTRDERQGVLDYINEQSGAGAYTSTTTKALGSLFATDSSTAAGSWSGAFAGVAR
jgi:hypothetical protein